MKYIIEMIADFLFRQKRRKIWHKIVSFMAAIVVFCTTYALILPAITLEKQLICTIDDIEHVHDETCYATSQQEEVTQRIYTYEGETTTVKVTLPLDSTVPEDAVLNVTPIVDTDDTYAELTQKAEETMEGQSCEVVLFDISFYTAENEYIPVSEEAMVSFEFKENILPEGEGDVTILHYEDETQEPVALENVKVETDENEEMTAVTFQTEGFSVFAMVKVLPDITTKLSMVDLGDSFDINNLNGKRYVITNYTSIRMLSNKRDDEFETRRLDVLFSNVTGGAEKPVYWTFEGTNGIYLLRSGNQYLKADGENLTVVTSKGEASSFTVSKNTNKDGLLLNSGKNINLHGGADNPHGFAAHDATDGGSHLKLYTDGYVDYEMVTGLGGRSYAIINFNWDNQDVTTAIMNTVETDATTGLQSLDAKQILKSQIKIIDGKYYFDVSDDITLWTFESTMTTGSYYIKDSSGKYINIGGTNKYDVILSDTPQEISVVSHKSTGKLFLENESSDVAISLAGTDVTRGFIGINVNWSYDFILAEKLTDLSIYYDINLPSLGTTNGSKSWKDGKVPSIVTNVQEISADGTLFSKPNNYFTTLGISGTKYKEKHPTVADMDNPYYGMYRMNMLTPSNTVVDNRPTLDYEEYRFNGWIGTVNGEQYLFEPDAAFVYTNAGIKVSGKKITDNVAANELTEVTIPFLSTLRGSWTQVSAPAYFFINYTGTILDTEGDVKSRNTGQFLNGVATAWIFFAKQTVGADGSFALEVNEKISAMFVNNELLDLEPKALGTEETQIMILTATTHDGEDLMNNPDYAEANSKVITEAALTWIREDDKINIKISTGNGETKVNNDQATSDNYSVRWYVLKEINDGWHIDAVMTAVTKTLRVTKSFAGLDDLQIQELLKNFHIDLKIRGSGENETYMTLCSDKYKNTGSIKGWDGSYPGVKGQFQYLGYDSVTKSLSWNVQLLVNEHVTLHEKDFTVTDYIDKSYSIIDGEGETIYTGTLAGYDISVLETNEIYDVLGGTDKLVAFSNTYTEKGKGSLSVLKKDAMTQTVLQNVTFTLKDSNGNAIESRTTDASGRVDFMNLKPGTYTLEETKVDGYHEYPNIVTIVVGEPNTSTGQARVTVTESKDGSNVKGPVSEDTAIMYAIENIPEPNTLIVEKDFHDITSDQVSAIVNNYCITLEKDGDIYKTLKVNDTGAETPIYKSTDGLKYQWLIKAVGNNTYTVKEANYASSAYVDTVVGAEVRVNGGDATELNPNINRTAGTASVDVTTAENQFTELKITNTYTDEFTMYLQKRDSITHQPLAGAIFKLYGSYDESSRPKDTIKYYTDASRTTTQTLYYIGETEASDENGLAKLSGLKLSDSAKDYVYVLSEIQAPVGYVKPEYDVIPYNNVIRVSKDTVVNNVVTTELLNQTIGAKLIVKKEVPIEADKSTLTGTFPINISISAPEASYRNANRQYTYKIYNADGTQSGTAVTGGGSAPIHTWNIDRYEFTVHLAAGQYVVVENVPVHYIYTVQEIKTSEYYPAIDSLNGTGVFDVHAGTDTGKVLDTTGKDENLNTVLVQNYSAANKDKAVAEVTTNKVWLPADKAGTKATLNLYQITNGDVSTAKLYGSQEVTDEMGWTYTWTNLPIYSDTGDALDYYVAETPCGYIMSYDKIAETITVSGQTVGAVHITNGTVTVTNEASYELPDTGSTGTQMYTIGGLVLVLAGAFLYRKKRTEVRCADDS